jgi:hypothetical protein
VKDIIKNLGGKEETDHKLVTHYIVSNNKINEFKSFKMKYSNINNEKILVVNLKWLLHCYFNVKKMKEDDNMYRINL